MTCLLYLFTCSVLMFVNSVANETAELTCGHNEQTVDCPPACHDYCPRSEEEAQMVCTTPKPCLPPACRCLFNQRRAANGTCIPARDCPPFKCDKRPNEEYNACPPYCPGEDCRYATADGKCHIIGHILIVLQCRPNCRCIKGYWRKDGICVPYAECPKKCGLHEVSKCVKNCPPEKTCKNRHIKISCLQNDTEVCQDKCRCDDNYYRNAIGQCVTSEECDKCPGEHEYFSSCGGGCDNVCATLHKQSQDNCPIRNIKCNSMCYCKRGYARDKNNVCIPIEKCPPPPPECNRPNEEVGCLEGEEKTCKTRDSEQCESETECSKKTCVCKKGFYRNFLGDCVSSEECDKCPGEHEFFACDSACDNVCTDIDTQNRTNCPIKNIMCNRKCYCEDGYARNKDNICVPIEKCPPPPPKCNRPNEEVGCLEGEEKTCKTRDSEQCESETDCSQKTCVCKKGFYRNFLGDCVSSEECDKCPGEHEFFACDSACDNVCTDIDTQNRTNCPIKNIMCNRKCYCEDGYARNKDNICVPIKECPPALKCNKPNEVPGCLKDGEVEKTCKTRNSCEDGDESEDDEDCCEPACVCKEGYYRNYLGECISSEECDKCPGEHEFFSCNSNCDNECSSIDTQNRTNCPSSDDNTVCNPKCYCEDGFARNDENICIPVKQCNDRCTGPHEYYQTCKRTCPPDTCMSLVAKFKCVANPPCVPGCICQSNYLRKTKDSPCVPMKTCPELANSPDFN